MDSAELFTYFSDPVTCPGSSRVLPTAVRSVPDNIPTVSSLALVNDMLLHLQTGKEVKIEIAT